MGEKLTIRTVPALALLACASWLLDTAAGETALYGLRGCATRAFPAAANTAARCRNARGATMKK
jgi:hypothetical protein